MKQKVFTLLTLLVLCVTGAWADDVIFSMSGVNDVTTGTLGTDYTVDGDVISVIHQKTIGLSATYTNGTAEVRNGHSSKDNLTVNKKTGVINIGNSGGSYVCITLTSGTIQEGDVISIDEQSGVSEKLGPSSSSLSELAVPYTVAPGSALINSNKLYIAKKDIATFSSVTITRTPAGPKTATFSLSKTTITAGETAKILVDGEDIFAANFTAGTLWESEAGGPYITMTADGIITGVKNTPDGYYCTFNATSKDLEKYNSSTGVRLDFAVATSYDITKGTHTNGDFTITPAAAAAGTEITLAATPSSGYDFASWTILKTSDDSDVTDAVSLSSSTAATATFTLPAYGVTVNATFEAAKYTVTYDVNGGGSCATASEKQASAGAAVTLPTPTWAGYTFDGWYNAGTKIGDAGDSYTPTSNITLYAKWTDNIEGKIFSYVDGNFGDKFQAFDASGSVTANGTNKSKTFTDGTTGAQFVVENGAWDKKNNSISALAKLVKGTSTMSIVIPAGYLATVKILYGAYGTGDDYKMTVNGTDQAAASAKFDDGHTNAQVASDMRDVILNNQSGTLNLSVHGNKNIYIARVAVVLTHVTGTVGANGYTTFASSYPLDLTDANRPAGLKAYKATRDGANLTFTALNQTVPAGTGLLLLGETKGGNYDIPVAASGDAVSSNALVGVIAPTAKQSDPSGNYYFVMKKAASESDALVFAPLSTSSAVTIPAGKAYVEVPNSAFSGPANELTISFEEDGDVTGIQNLTPALSKGEGAVFDLQGRQVTQPTKGLYIVNGKKVVLK